MFKIFKCDKGNNPIIKELPASEGTFAIGDLLVLSAGKLAKCGATAKPQYVCAEKGAKVVGDTLAVNPIYPDMEFLTTFSAAGTSIVPGNKVTISADANEVTATTASGVATVLEKLGTGAIGTEVIVKFE